MCFSGSRPWHRLEKTWEIMNCLLKRKLARTLCFNQGSEGAYFCSLPLVWVACGVFYNPISILIKHIMWYEDIRLQVMETLLFYIQGDRNIWTPVPDFQVTAHDSPMYKIIEFPWSVDFIWFNCSRRIGVFKVLLLRLCWKHCLIKTLYTAKDA